MKSVATPGVQSRSEPVDQHIADVLLQARGVLVAGRERVPVGDEEVALVLVLQLDPVAQRAVIVAQVQRARGTHARQNPAGSRDGAHSIRCVKTGIRKLQDHVA